jgi:hypothetical protein
LDVNLQLPGGANVQIVDNQGNLVQSSQIQEVPVQQNSVVIGDVPNPDKEFYKKKKQQKILQL